MPIDNCVTKAKGDEPYRVDDRVVVGRPLQPTAHNIFDGPTVSVVSGVRLNASGN